MIRRALRYALACALPLVLGTGCSALLASSTSPSDSVSASSESFSDSSNSISESISNSSESISGSGGDVAAESERLFREDVRSLARGAGEDVLQRPDAFLLDLGRLSEAHGITAWEMRDDAWTALRTGLGEAGLGRPEVDDLLRALALRAFGEDGIRRDLVMQGFAEAGL